MASSGGIHYELYLNNWTGNANVEQFYRPVINLKADVKFKGDGSYETPYEIIID
jgi:hypothetical protein